MKALAFDRNRESVLLLPPEVALIADSAITSPGHPVFLPDLDSEWIAEFYLAFRISRLGKHISRKFASRYFDSMTVAMRIVPVTIDRELTRAGRAAGIIGLFDNALTPGRWIGLPADETPVLLTVNGVTVTVDGLGVMAAEAVSAASDFATLKTGDLIMPCRVVPSVSVSRGTVVECSVGGIECLGLKIH